MSRNSIDPLVSEDLLNKEATESVDMTVDKSLNGQCELKSPHLDGTTEEEVKPNVESRDANLGTEKLVTSGENTASGYLAPKILIGDDLLEEAQHGNVSVPATGTANEKGIEDVKSAEGNHGIEKLVTINKNSTPSLTPEIPHGDNILMETHQNIFTEPAKVTINKEVNMDSKSGKGNHEIGELVTTDDKTAPSHLTENSLGDDVHIGAQHASLSEPATGTVGEVPFVGNHENTDDNIVDSLESSSRSRSSSVRQSSSDFSVQKVAEIINFNPVEADPANGDAIAQEVVVVCDANVPGVAAVSHEMRKESLVKGSKQDELPVPVLAEEFQHAVLKQSDSILDSLKANIFAKDKEISHLEGPEIPSSSKADDSFSVELPNNPQPSVVPGTVVGAPVEMSTTPKNKKRSQGVKESSEPKKRRLTTRKIGKKGDQPNETTLLKQMERDERPVHSLPPVGSSLSTFNFSASLPAALQQPFTDLQQLQLRAQIFVYGSLIQGTAPDEACLISAFGGPDGERSLWEKPWQKCLERTRNQTVQTNLKSPVLQNSGKSAPNQKGKSTPNQTSKRKALGSAGKSDSSQALIPMIPLSSPLWNMQTTAPNCLQVTEISRAPAVDHNPPPPLHPWQTPTKNMGHPTSLSSLATFPLPWVASAQTSAWEHSISLSAMPSVQPVKLIPVKDSTLISYSTANISSPDPFISNNVALAASADMVGTGSTLNSMGHVTKDSKSKKRKKVTVSEDPRQVILPNNSIQPVTVRVTSLTADNVSAASTIPLHFTSRVFVGDKDADRENMLPEDTLHQVSEAKLHAEEAAACAEAAVSRSQHVWGQLNTHKKSGLTVNHESKVASAAVAIAAAASVAKAAAAAAKLAFDAALQAKLMIEESSLSGEYIKFGFGKVADSVNSVGEVTPASVLKGENRAGNPSSIISAAKEAARRKIQSALAASKHAENLDAIVKAAELSSEAVAQAGKIVAIGDPPSLSALVELEPEGYWKLSHGLPEQLEVSNSGEEVPKVSKVGRQDSGLSLHTKFGSSENRPDLGISLLETTDYPLAIVGHDSTSIANENLTANAVAPPMRDSEMKSPSLSLHQKPDQTVETSPDSCIEEGSIVEVFKEWGTVRAAWFAARVIDTKDEEVYVSYIEKQPGGVQYKEWITLSCEDYTAPRVRIPHPLTLIPSHTARKRRRTNIGSRSWEVGDKVDAWMMDCWWEGMIIEKNGKDESSLTVQFPAQGETCLVKAWNLRPSLIWKDGSWVQWSNPNKSILSRLENDTPKGKRQKLSSYSVDLKGKGKATEVSDNADPRVHNQSSLTGLSEHEKTFNIGKSTRDEDKVDQQRMVCAGLQKERSNVIFGVPKPGKKRKFMDVSKHYVAGGRAKVTESNEPQKTRVPISRGLQECTNSNSRTEAQPKAAPKYRPKVVKSAKAISATGTKKDASNSAASDVDKGREMHFTAGDDSASGTDRQAEIESCSNADDDTILISSLARLPSDPSLKNSALGNMKSEGASKGKLGLSHAKMDGVEDEQAVSGTTQQEAPDASEPRRSNRRIQPTSRLLEGLQTSLSTAKVPSTVDKSLKSHNKNASLKES